MNVAPTASPIATPSGVKPTGQLAALRALQKALESEQKVAAQETPSQDGKGRHLDLRC